MTGVQDSIHVEKCACLVSLTGDNFQMKGLNPIKIVFHKRKNVFNARHWKFFKNWLLKFFGLKFPKYYYSHDVPLWLRSYYINRLSRHSATL